VTEQRGVRLTRQGEPQLPGMGKIGLYRFAGAVLLRKEEFRCLIIPV
jgi:hypothetical protein